MNKMMKKRDSHFQVKTLLMQMVMIFLVIVGVSMWQYDTLHQIYIVNQVNSIGWVVNGGIASLFLSGLFGLVRRFLEYARQEINIKKFVINVDKKLEPLMDIQHGSIIAQRFITLKTLVSRGAEINHAALAATLQADESSRNSFLKFVHNVLILTGVFGTVISLSIALFGASDLLTTTSLEADFTQKSDGLDVMIYGMSTALSTTLSAIMAYLFFGYFYIKLTDTQTFLISKVEEVTSMTLIPHLSLNKDAHDVRYIESLEKVEKLIDQFGQSQESYALSVLSLKKASDALIERAEIAKQESSINQDIVLLLRQIIGQQQQIGDTCGRQFEQISLLLQHGFRLSIQDVDQDG